MIKIILPLYVYTTKAKTTKSKFILNLNVYSNCHFRKKSTAKRLYSEIVAKKAPENTLKPPYELIFTYYHGSRHKVDISNPLAIIDKFACDGLTECGFWIDDNSDIIKKVTYIWGGIDRNRGRAELVIKEFTK